jgi:hypothetical protein
LGWKPSEVWKARWKSAASETGCDDRLSQVQLEKLTEGACRRQWHTAPNPENSMKETIADRLTFKRFVQQRALLQHWKKVQRGTAQKEKSFFFVLPQESKHHRLGTAKATVRSSTGDQRPFFGASKAWEMGRVCCALKWLITHKMARSVSFSRDLSSDTLLVVRNTKYMCAGKKIARHSIL